MLLEHIILATSKNTGIVSFGIAALSKDASFTLGYIRITVWVVATTLMLIVIVVVCTFVSSWA